MELSLTVDELALLTRIEQGVTNTQDAAVVRESLIALREITVGAQRLADQIVAALNSGNNREAIKTAERLKGVA